MISNRDFGILDENPWIVTNAMFEVNFQNSESSYLEVKAQQSAWQWEVSRVHTWFNEVAVRKAGIQIHLQTGQG